MVGFARKGAAFEIDAERLGDIWQMSKANAGVCRPRQGGHLDGR